MSALADTTFLLHEDALPGTSSALGSRFQVGSHGRMVTRSQTGLWLCAFLSTRGDSGRNWLCLSVSDSADAEGCEFQPPLLVAGQAGALFDYRGDFIRATCLLTAEDETLHLFYDDADGIHHLTASLQAPDNLRRHLRSPTAWTHQAPVAGGGSLLWDATLLPAAGVAVYYTSDQQLYERRLAAGTQPIDGPAVRVVVHVDRKGVRHVAFERDRQIHYSRSVDGLQWTDSGGRTGSEIVACYHSTCPAIAVTDDGTVVIAYQGEGKVALKSAPGPYSLLRRSGGGTISYAVLTDNGWRLHDLVRSREILLKRYDYTGRNRRTSDVRFEPFMEEVWRPSLAVDRHGVIWLFYPNTTRRHTYYARFQGRGFGDIYEARGPYDGLSRVLLVQKESRGQAAIGTLTAASGRLYFDAHLVPAYRSSDSRRIVFLDNLEVAEIVNLSHDTGCWEKHTEPLLGYGIRGDWSEEHVNYAHVVASDGGYEMHYATQTGSLRRNSLPGRAFSTDGIRWSVREPADETAWTLDDHPLPSSYWRPIFLHDPGEPDPARRYKGLLGNWRSEDGVEMRRWDVVTSADGKAWHTVDGLPAVVTGDISVPFHLLRDDEDPDPRRRYKASMLVNTDSGRGVAVFTSPDLIHWSRAYSFRKDPDVVSSAVWRHPTGPLPLHADGAESPWEEEVHDAILWREHGLLMFHYDAFYFDGNQHVDKALAVSRDGKRYHRIRRGAVNLPHGNCGEWDSGRVRTSVPIRVGGELRLYYGGMQAQTHHDIPVTDDDLHAEEVPEEQLRKGRGLAAGHRLRTCRIGMARMRVDGWGYLQLERRAAQGWLTTIPFHYEGGRLVVNGVGLGANRLAVEVLPASEQQPMPGFACSDVAFGAEEGIAVDVSWRGGPFPAAGDYRLRFAFADLASRLYSFGFETRT